MLYVFLLGRIIRSVMKFIFYHIKIIENYIYSINIYKLIEYYKLEIKESNDLIDHDKLVIDHLSEEISKLKKSKAKLEQDKQKIKQESLLLKKSMLEMKSKSDREYEMVTSSLMKLSNKFKALKAEMYNSKIN